MNKNKSHNNGNDSELSAEDQALWEFMMRDVTPIQKESLSGGHDKPISKTKPLKSDSYKAPALDQPIIRQEDVKPAPHHNLHDHGNIDGRSFDRFKKGQMTIDARLDLHGYNQDQAHQQLNNFIPRCANAGMRCVIIITGKGDQNRHDHHHYGEGRGVLKRMLPTWLEQPQVKPYILKVQQAQRQHGGSGAFYILLRRNKG